MATVSAPYPAMIVVVSALLAVCALAVVAWVVELVRLSRAAANAVDDLVRYHRRAERMQRLVVAIYGFTGVLLMVEGARSGQRWVVLLVVAAPIWVAVAWATQRLRR